MMPGRFTYSLDEGRGAHRIQEVRLEGGMPAATWRPVHPIPDRDEAFEMVWKRFRECGGKRGI